MTLPRSIRDAGTLRAEAGATPWCGPSAVALVTGLTYPEAERRIRAASVTPSRPRGRYKPGRRLTITYWPDLVLAAARALSGSADPLRDVQVFQARRGRLTYPTLTGFAREQRQAGPGWFLVRVTGHFIVLHVRARGEALVFDNAATGKPVSACGARKRVTHAARVLAGPLVA
jgi:hypothetical protein